MRKSESKATSIEQRAKKLKAEGSKEGLRPFEAGKLEV